MRVDDYLLARRDSVAEAELSRRPRELPPDESYDFITEYIDKQPTVGLLLANRVLRDPRQFERILFSGFRCADASTIRYWLEACVVRIGARRALRLFEALVRDSPEQAKKMIYWTYIILHEAEPALISRLEVLRSQLCSLQRR